MPYGGSGSGGPNETVTRRSGGVSAPAGASLLETTPVDGLGGDQVPLSLLCRPALRGLALALALVVVAPAAPAADAAPKVNAVEDHYRSAGPWVVATTDAAGPDGLTYRISHPRDLGRGEFNHPILIWGNGSN